MKGLFVGFSCLTLLVPLSSPAVQAQRQQDQAPGAGQCPPQRMNNGNNMGDQDFAPDHRPGPPNGDSDMDRESGLGGSSANTESGTSSSDGSKSNRFNQGGFTGNGPAGGGPGRFRRGGPGDQGPGGGPQEMAERRQRMMKRFDTNGDGVLDDNERAKMREFFQQRRQAMQNGANEGGDFQGGPPPPRQSQPQ